jgi:hypothetical protein
MNDDPTQAVSPLRQRMIDDMTMRRLSPKTQTHYIRAVKRLAQFLGRSPDTVNGEELRRFQLHLVQIGMSPISINSTIVGIRFFLESTLERPELMNKMRPVRVEQRLPVGGLRHGAARGRDRCLEEHGYRQRAHDAARSAGQGPQRPLRGAAALAAGAPAPVVAIG